MNTSLRHAPSLPETQEWMSRVITEPCGVRAALQAAPAGGEFPVIGDKKLAVDQRLGVYSDAYALRLLEALGANYPALRRALGLKAFHGLAVEFLIAHPPTSYNIDDAGELLPRFLAEHRLTLRLPFLPDLARLELEVMRSVYSDRGPAQDFSRLQGRTEADWAETRLGLGGTVRLWEAAWPVDQFWRRRRLSRRKGLRRPSRPRRRRLVIYRNDRGLWVRALSAPQWLALTLARERRTLGRICEALAERFAAGSRPPRLMDWFGDWAREGIIGRAELPRRKPSSAGEPRAARCARS